MSWLAATLRAHPELALFLVLALGYGAARLRIGPIKLNVMVGVLLAGVAVGQIGVTIPSATQWSFFVLFLFAIGYKSGPQFFRSLGRDALPHVTLTIFLCVTGLATTYMLAKLLGFDAGMAAGLLAGSLTESAAVGTAADALGKLPVEESARAALSANLTVAFALSYLVGLLTVIFVIAQLGPRLMRVDLAAECRKLESEIGVERAEAGVFSAYQTFVARAYAIPAGLGATTVGQLERMFAPARVFVERVRTGRGIVDATPNTPLAAGDVVALSGRREAVVDQRNPLRTGEVDDAELLDVVAMSVDVVLTRRGLAGRAYSDVVRRVGEEVATRGVFVRSITRGGEELPLGPHLVLERGDVLRIVGAKVRVERVAHRIGFPEWPSDATDLLTVAAAIVIGGLVGVPAARVAGFELGLSVPVGVLAGGLFAGWLRSLHPVFGRVPEPALWMLDSLGLTAFIASVGINAGPGFAHGLQTSGLVLVPASVLACALPHVLAILVGRYVLRLHPGIVLGICAGAGTGPFALAAVEEVAASRVPALGYGVSYAVGNVLLALWGSVVVALMTARRRPLRAYVWILAIVTSVSLLPRTAWCETMKLELTNGDIVTGEVVERTDRHIVLQHPVLGRLDIPIEQVTPGSMHPGILGTSFLEGWDKELDFGLAGSRGDTNEADIHLSMHLDRADEHRHWQLDGTYELSYSEGDIDEHDARVTGLRDWLWPGSRWFAFAYGVYDFDDFEAWKHRTTFGAGPAYHLLPKPPFTLDARFGPFITYEFGDEQDARPEGAVGLFAKWQIREGDSLTVSNVYYQTLDEPELRNVSGFEWKVRLALSRALSFKIGARNEYDTASRDSKNNLKYYSALSFDL